MGGQRQVLPGKVYRNVSEILNSNTPIVRGVFFVKPPWHSVLQSIPPSETLTRPLPVQHNLPNPKARRPSRMFQPQKLVYEEDALRQKFYRDHPWELARPRMILEMDGKDALRYNWSKGLRQPGMPLCGESVVQRQLWMMHNLEGMTEAKAYDIVRHEFYRLRQLEEVERRVAKEEAMKVGAYFFKSALQIGMELEDKEFEGWKRATGKKMDDLKRESDAAYMSFGGEDIGAADDADADAEAET
ncbi:mitochondrial ribosomal protein [Xylariaceae sp. FL0594]|nr:mitochondrial ribosomal protein [Xylariaceae sp. FL0594]